MTHVNDLMTGFPASPENQVDLSNWRFAPYNSWAFHHVRELLPTANVMCHPDYSTHGRFQRDGRPIKEIVFEGADGVTWTIEKLLATGNTDAFMVVRDNNIITEQYFNGQQRHDPHVIFSVSKSVTGLLAGILVDKGFIDPEAPAIKYIPEALDSAWGNCSLRHILDMTVGIKFDEDYEDMQGDVARYRRATGWDLQKQGELQTDLRQYLLTLKPNGKPHGEVFLYVSPNTDFLGWILERVTQKSWANLVSEYIWQPMGAEYDGYMTVDRCGAPRAAGGFCITIRDMARLALMVMNDGRVGDKQIVPEHWLNDIHQNGNPLAWSKGTSSLFPNGCYRSFWYQTGYKNNAFCGIGIHGQWIYCDPVTRVVIVRQASQGFAVDDAYDHTFLAACEAISDWLSDN